MDPSLYKDLIVSRGLTYHYFILQPQASKPWLLLLHGFPSTSYDWVYQIAFFKNHGFGLVVPDMLGYGGTSKPLDTQTFKSSLICKDIIDILDAESVKEAVVIGHDWGSKIASRLYNYYPNRFKAFAFLSISYLPPDTAFGVDKGPETAKNVLGYQMFFSETGADQVILEHIDTFFDVCWAEDPNVWVEHLVPLDVFKTALLDNKRYTRGPWLSKELQKALRENVLKGGFASPLQWYKVNITGIDSEDCKGISPSWHVLNKPTFFGATIKDGICTPSLGKQLTSQFCKGPTVVKDFDASHWVMFERKDELNAELLAWINTL